MTYDMTPPPHPPVCQGRFRYLLYRWAAAALIGLPACASKPKDTLSDDMREEGKALFGTTPKASASAVPADTDAPTARTRTTTRRTGTSTKNSPAATATDGWAIVLEYARGTDHARTAAQRRLILAREIGRDDLAVRSRPDGSAVVLGSYASASDPRAQQDLDWVRTLTRGKSTPFARAFLLPPTPTESAETSENPEWNLATVRDTRAGDNKAYTLQVAVFDGAGNLARARSMAEAYTAELRRTGEEAYFFHGHALSVVTVGLFAANEADDTGTPRSAAARSAHRAHPHNLKDGTDPIPDRTGAPQPSALMRIP
jgi:hypothetical protein